MATLDSTAAPSSLKRPPLAWNEAELAAMNERARQAEIDARNRQVEQLQLRLAADLGARNSCANVGLAQFELYHANQSAAIGQFRDALATWPDSLQRGEGLVLWGTVGVGKTRLMAAALYTATTHLLSARWVSAQDLFARIRDSMDSRRSEEELLRGYESADVLGIDDLLPATGELSPWNAQLLTRLVEGRYRRLKPVFVSVNAESEEDAAERLTHPLYDRLRHGSTVIACRWPSYRQRRQPSAKGPMKQADSGSPHGRPSEVPGALAGAPLASPGYECV